MTILDDLIEGASKGFDVMDADGVNRKVFLDVVGILGDTPALNASLDVMGHTALACCHLCGFRKQPSTCNTSLFTISTHSTAVTAAQRSTAKHQAIFACSPTGSVLRNLDIKETESSRDKFLFHFSKKLKVLKSSSQFVSPCPSHLTLIEHASLPLIIC